MKYLSVLWISTDYLSRVSSVELFFDTFYTLLIHLTSAPMLDFWFVSCPCFLCIVFAEAGHTKAGKLMNICRIGRPKKWTFAILVFPLGQNMSAKLLQQVWFISFGGKNYCFGASGQFTSITSLSDDEYHKFRAIITSSCPQVCSRTQKKTLSLILSTFLDIWTFYEE